MLPLLLAGKQIYLYDFILSISAARRLTVFAFEAPNIFVFCSVSTPCLVLCCHAKQHV